MKKTKTQRKSVKAAAKKTSAKTVKLFSLEIGDKFHFVDKKRVYTVSNADVGGVYYKAFGKKFFLKKNVPVVAVK